MQLSHCLMTYWSISTFLCALFGTFAYGTADWIAAEGAEVTDQGFSRIRLGMVYVCYDAQDGTTSCGRYGSGLEDIPTLSWRVSTFFFGLGLVLSWGTALASLLIPCVAKVARWATSAFVVASVFFVLAAFIFAGGFADLNPERFDTPLFAVCNRADSFFPGECNLDSAAFVGFLTTASAVAVAALGLMARPTKDDE
eukprot:m.18175 g.18175  ORF g.18175 m.18175 type:complete len:197 (+) comp10767_c0_seq1:90-680(+)